MAPVTSHGGRALSAAPGQPSAGARSRAPASVSREQVARHYDELDAFYRDIWGEHVHHGLWHSGYERPEEAVEQLVTHVADRLALRAGDVVVDVGAGYGATARQLARDHGVEVTGLTVSAAQHAYAMQVDAGHSRNPRLLLRDWLENRMAAASADAVLAIESTEHMADLPLALAEMRRVLLPGGRVAICAWLAGDAPSPWERRLLVEPIRREGRLVTMTTADAYTALLRDAGFERITFEDLTANVRRTWSVCLGRIAGRIVSDPRYLRYAVRARNTERVFLLTMLRILAAYRVGAMRYGLFVAHAPGTASAADAGSRGPLGYPQRQGD